MTVFPGFLSCFQINLVLSPLRRGLQKNNPRPFLRHRSITISLSNGYSAGGTLTSGDISIQ
jgi:hypothetical protein